MRNKLQIAVFTGNRAEYGQLRQLILSIQENKSLELKLFVSASHLSQRFGSTISEIYSDNIKISKLIPIELDTIPMPSMTELTSMVIKGMGEALEDVKPYLCILLGDRYETFGAATACHLNKIPIAHLHGGETTLGAIDDKLRHSISQLSTWHFTAAEEYRNRVINMGHNENNVFNVGPLALDGIANKKDISRKDFEESTGYKFSRKNLIITYHPETLLKDNGVSGFHELLEAIKDFKGNILFTHPNADAGGSEIIDMIKLFSSNNSEKTFVVPSLGNKLYLSALSLFEGLLGNSSSGIIEAPIIGIPVLNIGNRQKGRLKFGKVHDVKANSKDIKEGIKSILSWNESNSWPRRYKSKKKLPSEFILSWLLDSIPK